MRRRDFIKSGLISLGTISTTGLPGLGQNLAQGTYVEGQRFTLSNKYLDWDLFSTVGTIRSIGVRNELSGRYYKLEDSKELLLTFSQAKARIEVPWWSYWLGPDDDSTPPDQERGYVAGHHREDLEGEAKWSKTINLLLRGEINVQGPPIHKGYAWFRQRFELPKEAEGQPIVFCFGGYNQEDWKEYWLYVNGIAMGHWTRSGRWRTPGELTVLPGSKEYGSLRFGGGSKNLLAIRTRDVDKRSEEVTDDIVGTWTFDGRLADQFIAVGKPYHYVSDFKLRSWRQEAGGERPKYVFQLTNDDEQLEVAIHYELDEFIRRKWLEIRNVGRADRLLLDVDVDDFRLPASTSEGDLGFPVMIEEEVFCALEHPGGLSQGMSGRVRLRHFPGKALAAGATIKSEASILGVSSPGTGRQQFLDYIQSRSPRKGLLSIHDPFGTNGFPDAPCWTLNDEEMLESLDLLARWQKQGVKFDYYVPDVGWQDNTGDLTRYWPHCFPEGPERVIKRANELGMKWGLWFSGTWGDWSCGLNPRVEPSRIIVSGGKWPEYLTRDGFEGSQCCGASAQQRQLCLASEPYFSMLRDALLYHIRHYNLRFWKLDTGSYYCNNTSHPHMAGKYSNEANFDAVIEIARATRQACPDVYIMWYGGIRSPFFLFCGDSIYESRIAMEAASSFDYPTLFFRDGVTLALDCGNRTATKYIPPMCMDTLGVWITDTFWGSYMKKERWREAAVMDLGRGNLLFPQLWGDLYKFSEEDVAFLARIQKLAKDNEPIFYKRRTILGDPWKNEVYGYAYFQQGHGFLFMNNVDFQSRPVRFTLDNSIGLKAPAGTKLRLVAHFPTKEELRLLGQAVFTSRQTIETWLRPFEVALWEVVPETGTTKGQVLPQRELPTVQPDVTTHLLALEAEEVEPRMEIYFDEPIPLFRAVFTRPTLDELKQKGYSKRIIPRRAKISELAGKKHVLALVLRLRKDGKPLRSGLASTNADLIQIMATVGDQSIRFEAVPSFRQYAAGPGWLVFKIRTNPAWSGKDLRFAINAYLPPEVECHVDGYVVPQWWN